MQVPVCVEHRNTLLLVEESKDSKSTFIPILTYVANSRAQVPRCVALVVKISILCPCEKLAMLVITVMFFYSQILAIFSSL